jgi:hypothetical protein
MLLTKVILFQATLKLWEWHKPLIEAEKEWKEKNKEQ